jgi:hypothetical protein
MNFKKLWRGLLLLPAIPLLCQPAGGTMPTGRADPFRPLIRPKEAAPALPNPPPKLSPPSLLEPLHDLPESTEDAEVPKLLGIISDRKDAVVAIQLGFKPVNFLKLKEKKQQLELLSFGRERASLNLKGKIFYLNLSGETE